MASRMRTSKTILEQNYLKNLDTDNLIKVKLEPNDDLIMKASAGTTKDTAYPVRNTNIQKINPPTNKNNNIEVNIGSVEKRLSREEQVKKNMKKYMETNKKKHQEKMRSEEVYAKRIIRELNNGLKKSIMESTIKKYELYKDDGVWKSKKY